MKDGLGALVWCIIADFLAIFMFFIIWWLV